MIEIKDK